MFEVKLERHFDFFNSEAPVEQRHGWDVAHLEPQPPGRASIRQIWLCHLEDSARWLRPRAWGRQHAWSVQLRRTTHVEKVTSSIVFVSWLCKQIAQRLRCPWLTHSKIKLEHNANVPDVDFDDHDMALWPADQRWRREGDASRELDDYSGSLPQASTNTPEVSPPAHTPEQSKVFVIYFIFYG